MDAIRNALGEPKLNYLGFSYGTLLGAVYAELFPKNIRAMVLDGAVDPTLSPVDASEDQAVGFERAFNNFAAWCKATPQGLPDRPGRAGRRDERHRRGPDQPGQGRRRPGRHRGLGLHRRCSPRSTPRRPGSRWPRASRT